MSGDANRQVVREAVSELALRRLWMSNKGRRRKRLMIDVDGLPVQVHGQQPGSEYHGYYQQRMYHALVASCAESGDLIDGTLRVGAAGSADGALPFIQTVVERCRQRVCESVLVRIDAGFPDGETLKGLEAQSIDYVARIRNNGCWTAWRSRTCAVRGRAWCHELRYQADRWEHARRVVLVVVERPGELFVDHFWLITNLRADRYSGPRLLGLYRHAGQGRRAYGRADGRAGAGVVVGAPPEEPLSGPPPGG